MNFLTLFGLTDEPHLRQWTAGLMYRDKRERFLRVTDRVDEGAGCFGVGEPSSPYRIKPVGPPGQRMPLPQADDDIYLASADGAVLGLCRRGWLVHRDTA